MSPTQGRWAYFPCDFPIIQCPFTQVQPNDVENLKLAETLLLHSIDLGWASMIFSAKIRMYHWIVFGFAVGLFP